MARSWAVSHPRILRLNAALLNVLQTNSTDVNVTSDSGALLARGTDYEVVPPTTARVVLHNATFVGEKSRVLRRLCLEFVSFPNQRAALGADWGGLGPLGPIREGASEPERVGLQGPSAAGGRAQAGAAGEAVV